MVSHPIAPLPATPAWRDYLVAVRTLFSVELVPSRATLYVENTDVAARQKFERRVDLIVVVELGAALFSERLEPGRINEVGNQRAVDLISELIRLTSVADLVCVKLAGPRVFLDEYREVDFRIAEHLEKLVACRHRPDVAVLFVRAGEDLPQRKPFARHVVVS